MHVRETSSVCEIICAHNVLNERDELDTQPCPDVCDEFVCKGDFLTEHKLRGGCSMGGLPGLPSVVLFAFEESTSCIDVADAVLRIFKYWNLATSRPDVIAGNLYTVQSETAEFYRNPRANTMSARVSVKPIPRDRCINTTALLEHVHPDIRAKIDTPSVHPCRASAFVDSCEDADRIMHHLFECQLHVVPSRVRDSTGKTRFVVTSILKIRSKVPGCDPVLALRALQTLQGFSQELGHLTQQMLRLLPFHGDVTTDKIFDVNQDDNRPNLATIGHEANLPLAFFNFLRIKQMSCAEPSPFAADWMGQRIDVYDEAEVALFLEALKVAHYSRKQYYAFATLHTSHDQISTRNAQLHLPTTSVDWKLFFPGQHFRAVPKAALLRDFAQTTPTADERDAFDAFMDVNPDPTNVFFTCDGALYTRGYVCVMQPTMRSEDNAESVKLAQQQVFKEGEHRQEELQCVHYCSKRFSLFTAFCMAARDPYSVFLQRDVAYPTLASLQHNLNALTSIEREYFACMTVMPHHGLNMQRERMKTNLVNTVYGLSEHVLHSELHSLYACLDAGMLTEHTRDLIVSHVNKHVHVCANAPMQQLKHAARFLIDLNNVDESPPRTEAGHNIAQQHFVVHRHVCRGVVNDDAQAACREMQHFTTFKSELNAVNWGIMRWLLLAHVSVWSSTLDGCYGYCIQICDMGNSVRVCMKKGGKFTDDEMMEWDKKMPGSGADMVWNIVGEYVNGFPKFLCRTHAMREFFSGNNFCELYQQKSLMSFKRTNGIVKNVRDCVMESMSEHNQNMGIVGAMNELNKLEQDASKVNAIWPTLEGGLGQSGSTFRGVKEKPFTTTISGIVVNISVLNPLQIICLASNQLSVARPVSVNDGSRVIPMTSGCNDALGRVVDKVQDPVVPAQSRKKAKSLSSFTADILDIQDPRKVDEMVVRRNMGMFLMEYLARIFALVHRGLCLKRHVSSGFGMILWANTRNYCMHLTTNLRKATYMADDKMARNVNGSLETAVFGKWVRCVLQTALHRRLMQTTNSTTVDAKTFLRHVLPDAVTTFVLVPASTAVVLSALQIYLAMVVLDVGVMLVSCMVLYYLGLPRNCPMHVMALVIRGHEEDLMPAERQQYHEFAEFLHSKLLTGLVCRPCLATHFTGQKVGALLSRHTDNNTVSNCLSKDKPSVYCCDSFFPGIMPPREQLRANPTASEILACSFSMSQGVGSEARNASTFWANAGPGTRIPVPNNKSNDRNHRHFQALNECPRFYGDIRKKLKAQQDTESNFGVLINFMRMCAVSSDCSRYDLVTALLEPWAAATGVSLDKLEDLLHTSDGLDEDWARPIFSDKQQIHASMLEWAVQVTPQTSWDYTCQVGLAADVLWVIVSQALFADEWHSTPTERVSIVHTRNMSNAAQTLLSLYIHTSLPKAAVPACVDAGVLLSEPSQIPKKCGEPICVPYRARLHVDSQENGNGFLNVAMREPRHMRIVETTDGPLLISRHMQLLDRQSNDIGSDVLSYTEVCPFPAESVAHMLPAMQCLMRTFRRLYMQFPEMDNTAQTQWAVVTRIFGSSTSGDTLSFIPVALTQHALDEEIPCISYKHGFCFVLKIQGPLARLASVNVDTVFTPAVAHKTVVDHCTFLPLPLPQGEDDLCFPAEALSHAMAGGLVLENNVAVYRAEAVVTANHGEQETPAVPIPFGFMPIVRFQCLLMLELVHGRPRAYPETRAATLTVAVLNTHPDTSTFLLDGHYHVRYHDADSLEFETTVHYIFASQCMLRDGRTVYYTFTAEQFRQLVDEVCDADSLCPNAHVDPQQRFAPDIDVVVDDGFALQCHYTFSHEPRRAALAGEDGAHIRIAFVVQRPGDSYAQRTILYADVALFNTDGTSRLFFHPPDACTIIEHFVW